MVVRQTLIVSLSSKVSVTHRRTEALSVLSSPGTPLSRADSVTAVPIRGLQLAGRVGPLVSNGAVGRQIAGGCGGSTEASPWSRRHRRWPRS